MGLIRHAKRLYEAVYERVTGHAGKRGIPLYMGAGASACPKMTFHWHPPVTAVPSAVGGKEVTILRRWINKLGSKKRSA